MKIRIERMDEDGLARARWCFELVTDWGRQELVLEEYHLEHRESARKKLWEKDKVYLRVGDTRQFSAGQKVAVADVPVPTDVEADLRIRLIDFVTTVPVTRKADR